MNADTNVKVGEPLPVVDAIHNEHVWDGERRVRDVGDCNASANSMLLPFASWR